MPDGPNKNSPQSVSAEIVLRDVATRYRELIEGARFALHLERNIPAYLDKLRASGQLLVDLPKVLEAEGVDASALSERDRYELGYYSREASHILETGAVIGMGVLLAPRGSRMGGPNDLERLIERAYPSNPPAGE